MSSTHESLSDVYSTTTATSSVSATAMLLSSHNLAIPTTVTFVSPLVITITDYVTQTVTPTYNSSAAETPHGDTDWLQHDYPLLPILIAFAAVGVLSIFSFIFCMIYRCATQKKLRHNDDPDQYPFPQLSQKPESDAANPGRSMSRILPWLMIKSPNNERMESERDAHSRPMGHVASVRSTQQPWYRWRFHRKVNGGNKTEIVTSSLPGTFVPMHTSPLTLVPRHEIMGDPSRRRGVDEVDMWEQRQQQLRRPPMWQFNGDFPDSPPLAQLHETSREPSSVHIQQYDPSLHPRDLSKYIVESSRQSIISRRPSENTLQVTTDGTPSIPHIPAATHAMPSSISLPPSLNRFSQQQHGDPHKTNGFGLRSQPSDVTMARNMLTETASNDSSDQWYGSPNRSPSL